MFILKEVSFKIMMSRLARTHDAMDKKRSLKILQSEIIWGLQVQSQLQVRITRNTYYNLTLVPGHG